MEEARAGGATSAPTATPTTSSTSRAFRTSATPRSSSAIREDVTEEPFGPGLPRIRDWTDRTSPTPAMRCRSTRKRLPTREKLRARLGYRQDEKLAIAAVGGTAVGTPLLEKIAAGLPADEAAGAGVADDPGRRPAPAPARHCPRRRARGAALRAQPVRAPRLLRSRAGAGRPEHVHGAGRHAPAVPQLSAAAPLRAVRARAPAPRNYGADRAVHYAGSRRRRWPSGRCEAMHAPVRYKPVETDGAARAARRIAEVLENRAAVR